MTTTEIVFAVLLCVISFIIGGAFILIPYKKATRSSKAYGYKNAESYKYTTNGENLLNEEKSSAIDGANALKNFKQ